MCQLVDVVGTFPELPNLSPAGRFAFTYRCAPAPRFRRPVCCFLHRFEARAVQRELAEAVGGCLERGGVLLAEAGTGTGKSLAALLPALARARLAPR